jgi:tripartite-type tricarboxylate transporter receptor subunit TctC
MEKNMITRRQFLAAASAACATTAWAQPVHSGKPVRLIVPFPAGGATDAFARAISQKLGERLGVPVIVDNRPGAGGSIGSDMVAKAAPDGDTLLLATSSTHSIAPNFPNAIKLPYDAATDFTAISHLGDAPNIVLVPNSSPAKTMKEWVDYARKNPGKLNYGSSGNGTIVHVSTEYLLSLAGLNLVHIPYRGTGLSIPDLVSGKLDILIDSLPSGLPHVKSGRLRGLAITSLKRSPLVPDLPPVADTIPGYEAITWFGLYGPRNLPGTLVNRVNTAVNQVLQDKGVVAAFARLGIEAAGGTPEQFATMVAADRAKWKKIIDERKITNE